MKLRQNLRETLSGESKSRTREDDHLPKVSRHLRMDLGERRIHISVSSSQELLDQHQGGGHQDSQRHEKFYRVIQNSPHRHTEHDQIYHSTQIYGARSTIQRQV